MTTASLIFLGATLQLLAISAYVYFRSNESMWLKMLVLFVFASVTLLSFFYFSRKKNEIWRIFFVIVALSIMVPVIIFGYAYYLAPGLNKGGLQFSDADFWAMKLCVGLIFYSATFGVSRAIFWVWAGGYKKYFFD